MPGGFFGEQATRLLRESWPSADELAEELYAMASDTGPTQTDRPIQLTRNGDQPAIIIYDNSSGNTPPIQIVGGKKGTGATDPGNYQCCQGGGGSSGGGGGQPKPPDQGGGGPIGPGGPVNPSQPPGPVPHYLFSGTIEIQIQANPPDTFGWNGQKPSFSSSACLAYNPPVIPKPGTAWVFPDITTQLNAFLALPTLAPFLAGYTVTKDIVTGPGAACVP